MHDSLHRLYQAKLTVLALLLFFVGLSLLIFGHWIQSQPHWQWLRNWPIIDVGSGMFTTGLLGVGYQYIDGADSEVRDTERLKRVLGETAPAMRDAVINGFAFEPDDLARVATKDVLDKIIVNGLAIRLNDEDFAAEIFDDLRSQAIGPPERLEDVRVAIRLSMNRSTSKGRAPSFVATVRWEFRVTPHYSWRRFVSSSDVDEYRDLRRDDDAATSVWYLGPHSGLDAAAQSTFELVDFTVDGVSRPIRRSTKQDSQTYSVALGEKAMNADGPVSVAYTYRTALSPADHLLHLRVDQPTHGLAVTLDYSDTTIAFVNVLDFLAGGERPVLHRSGSKVPERTVSLDFDSWVFARAGLAFVWALEPPKKR
jgi:hypothetical protein